MVMVDSSAWIEFLRGTGSEIDRNVQALIRSNDVATCDPVVMEVLAGARDSQNLSDLKRLLATGAHIPTAPHDYEQAAAMYRTCRSNGETVRKMLDCLIASVAVSAGIKVLHADSDFETLGRHTTMQSYL